MLAAPNSLASVNGTKSKTEQILDASGLTKQRVAHGIVELVDGTSNDGIKLRALEVAAKMHGMLDDNKQSVTIQILNASGANLATMLGAQLQNDGQ